MATETKTVTLAEYANKREYVVLFWAGVLCPAGEEQVLGHPDLDYAEQLGIYDLTGAVDEEGTWCWDGQGDPTDKRGNSITKLRAWVDAQAWADIAGDYQLHG